ncbi:hypothetical protein D3C80_2054200 [compost metagenome]
MTSPVTSTSVATNGAEALAGSSLSFCKINGNIDPQIEPKVTIPTRAANTVKPTSSQCSP